MTPHRELRFTWTRQIDVLVDGEVDNEATEQVRASVPNDADHFTVSFSGPFLSKRAVADTANLMQMHFESIAEDLSPVDHGWAQALEALVDV